MKIEIYLTDTINEKCTGMTCFEAANYITDAIKSLGGIYGIVIIDGVAVKFYFSCLGTDGDIFTNNDNHRRIVKYIVPIYVYNNQTEILNKIKALRK